MTKHILRRTTVLAVITILSTLGIYAQTLRVSASQARTAIDRIRVKAATLQNEIDNYEDDNEITNADERASDNLTEMTTAAVRVRASLRSYARNTDVSTDLNTLFDRASRVNRIISRNSMSTRVTTQWASLRNDIETLAGYYGMSANWNTGGGWNNNNNGGWNGGGWQNSAWNDRVTGTYRLNTSASENVSDVIDRSLGYYSVNERDNQRRMLERRLASPEIIAIEKVGRRVTLGSSNQAQVTFDADGVARTETNPRGRTVTTRVTTTNNNLTIDYKGDRANDFNVQFTADRGGRLRVTRTIYLENLNQTVSVSSIYDRISQTADWSQVRTNDNLGYNNTDPNATTGGFYVPNGTTITATLRNPINTRASQVGDRFSMDVTSPGNLRGAVIGGRIGDSQSSGRITGRAALTLEFDTITLGGQTYRFAGLIQSASLVNGDNVTINNEGTIRDNSQTNRTVTRAGIGALLGAIIGAVAGGGSGAAIGAGVGAGAGAGSVLLGGRDTIEVGSGSTFTIVSSAPANVVYNPRN